MLIGMLNWIVGIGRFDIAHATTSLARFSSCPRKCHLDRALQVFGYLKKYPNKRILVDSRDPIITGGDEVKAKQLAASFREEYPDVVEEIDCNLPMPLVEELAIKTFVDSYHAHDISRPINTNGTEDQEPRTYASIASSSCMTPKLMWSRLPSMCNLMKV